MSIKKKSLEETCEDICKNDSKIREIHNRHAPSDHVIMFQFFEGETREEIISRSLEGLRDVFGVEAKQESLVILPGWVDSDANFRDDGWMVFIPKSYFPGLIPHV